MMDYLKLIKNVESRHLCSIEISNDKLVIKKQLGNKAGSKIEIEFNHSKRIQSINFEKGGYNEPKTLSEDFVILFDLIFNA